MVSISRMSHSCSDTVLHVQAITLKQATSVVLLTNGTTVYLFTQAWNSDWFLIIFLCLKRFKNTGLWAPLRDTGLVSGMTLSHRGLGLEAAIPISSCVICANYFTYLGLIFIHHRIGEYLP